MKNKHFFVALIAIIVFSTCISCNSSKDRSSLPENANSSLSVGYDQIKSPTPAMSPVSPADTSAPSPPAFVSDSLPAYSGSPYTEINDGQPFFTEEEKSTEPFETYSPLDPLGRCGVAFANICTELMPTEERGNIGEVEPAGWHLQRYDDLISDRYLYNRCHLIGYQLAGENANEENLITGTRYLNVSGMLPLENQVAAYVESTKNHVLYRVTPIYEGDNLLANGLLMEAYSVEDNGEGISFCNFVYNVQPYIDIDYATGDSSISANAPTPMPKPTPELTPELEPEHGGGTDYIANTNTRKFHYPYCYSVDKMKESNKLYFTGSRDELISQGYVPCKKCNP